VQLANGLFASVPIFVGGILNTTLLAAVAAWRLPSLPFLAWLVFEIVLAVVRLAVLVRGRRAIAAGRTPPRLAAALLSCVWAASVGGGTLLCLVSGDSAMATIACLFAAAMVCGICMRNFGTPRLAAVMVSGALAPGAFAGLMADERVMLVIALQLPVFIVTISAASFGLHRMMVSRMMALSELQRSETLNTTILQSSPDYTLILDDDLNVVFCNRVDTIAGKLASPLGRPWLSFVAVADRPAAERMLQSARAGNAGTFVTYQGGRSARKRWFHVIANRFADGSGRLMVVARDITYQKESEDRAIWMAQHDSLTGLPNRALLQERLDTLLAEAADPVTGALLILDVDNFKSINDTLGHDGGDALLRTFADRLLAAVDDLGFVARTGGDEFAILLSARSDAEIEHVAERIFAELSAPFVHGGRLLDCGASIGASFLPRDGASRSEIMKAADIALYAAKAGGRAQLRIFEPAMMVEVEKHQTMIASARYALRSDTIVPHYQPKVCLRSSRIVGFEALLRWRDRDGELRGPDALNAAFEDPVLATPLSDRMLEKILDDVQCWESAGLAFGHVAVNVSAADFRRGGFAETVLSRLSARGVPPSRIQIEVTETVFLGQGAEDVKAALTRLSDHGIRIALDDFGTGYASLSHLNQFPVDLLKIDRSFIQRIGHSADAEAISATVINLGHCLGLEVIAEGIETAAQEAQLIGMGCDTGQGFLYARALPAAEIPAALAQQDIEARLARRA
jgi:diguanylate cyclase (GGDEF)-like protein